MYVTTLPEGAHLRNRPRKNLKSDFPPEYPMESLEWWPFWHHSDGLLKLYILSYVDSRSIHWVRIQIPKIPGIQPIDTTSDHSVIK